MTNPFFRCPICGGEFPVSNIHKEVHALRERVKQLEAAARVVLGSLPIAETIPVLERALLNRG